MATFKIYLDVKVTDKDGKVHKHRRVRCHSFVRQMMDIMMCQMSQTSVSVKDYLAATGNVSSYSNAFDVYGLAANQLFGIVLGDGTTAVDISDYKMESIIPNATLMHGVTCVGKVAVVGSSASFVIDRTFVNHSGGSIDVHEVGLYGANQLSVRYFLLEHTLHDISIADGAYVNVTYTISITV